ncbi:MAG: pilus assembly protein [Pelagimonas sp.]|jgi:Flp pilus assembly pilin Flp|nr:pilus assembly protein [Pelagimonas sp.]
MMKALRTALNRFHKEEDGYTAVEVVIVFTAFIIFLMIGFELAYINLRQATLQQSVDKVVRELRLTTGRDLTYGELRSEICDEAGVLKTCDSNLRLEMIKVNPRQFTGAVPQSFCTNAAEDPNPQRKFTAGHDNEMMLMRVCLRYRPVIQGVGLSKFMNKDEQGYAALTVNAAFVQEPR